MRVFSLEIGRIAGAASGGFPEELKTGLADHAALAEEIDAFVKVACSGVATR